MASSKLVIVESPAKAKTINRFLGHDYKVVASMGHVRDLPENSLAIDVKADFAPHYEISGHKSKLISELKSAAKHAVEIYLAPDPDREGEAIAWHLKELLEPAAPKARFFRVAFHEITREAIERAFAHAGEINMNLVNAQQARRVLDRLVGYQVSPLLWSALDHGRGVSAGRVQSVALRLVVEREREILNFKPEEYWNLWVDLEADGQGSGKLFRAKFNRAGKKKGPVHTGSEAQKILAEIKGKPQIVLSAGTEPRKKYAPPPFITSTLQQIAGSVLGFSSKQTMQIAQELYEGVDLGSEGTVGLITYMRTDSVHIAKEAQVAAGLYIRESFGADYAPAKANVYRSKAGAQEAHEAIRPTHITFEPNAIKSHLTPNQFKLYRLIWRRFLASQMTPAQQRRATVDTQAEGTEYVFRAVATETVFPGYLKVFGEEEQCAQKEGLAEKDDEQCLPIQFLGELHSGDCCAYSQSDGEQKFTEPPARYSEATLVRALETNGVGRPSTYASIVSTIQDRRYAVREKGRLSPTELGFKVNDYLVNHLDTLFQVGFTADMEHHLDEVEEGKLSWVDMLHAFYDEQFLNWLNQAKYAGGPKAEQTAALLAVLDQIKVWPKVTPKSGAFDDGKYVKSLRKQIEKGQDISEKQWNTLLRVALSHAEELPNLKSEAEKAGFADRLEACEAENAERLKRNSEGIAPLDESERRAVESLFAALSTVEFDPPDTERKRVFNDADFVKSLQQQFEKGRALSEKQRSALMKIARKYSTRSEALKAAVQPGADESAVPENEADQAKITDGLTFLSTVSTWNPPRKIRGRLYDDEKFYTSIRDQFEAASQLSPKQIVALEKMVERYRAGASDEKHADALKRTAKSKNAEESAAVPVVVSAIPPEVKAAFETLEKVKTFDPGKGKFNNKTFYQSLKKQFDSGRILSEKQVNALIKLAKKYE